MVLIEEGMPAIHHELRFQASRCGRLGMIGLAVAFVLAVDVNRAVAQKSLVSGEREIVIESMTTTLIRHVTISTRDSGVIKSLQVKPGDRVAEGQILGSLDDELQDLAVRQADSNLRIAKVKAKNPVPVETARAQIREAEEMMRQLESTAKVSQKLSESEIAVRVTEKARELAEFELNRAQKAKESFSGSVTKVELNRLQTQLDQRTLEVEKAREDRAIATLKANADQAAVTQQKVIIERQKLALQEREQDVILATTEVEVAQAEFELAQLQLQRRRLVSPFSGFVEDVTRQSGEWVERGIHVLRIIQLDTMRVEGFANAEVSTSLRAGQKVVLSFSEQGLPEVEGIVSFVGREVEPVNQRVKVWAEFSNPELKIRPGLVATMRVTPSATGETP